jgi:hypothetical protein
MSKPRVRKPKKTPKADTAQVVDTEAAPTEEPSFFENVATIFEGGKEALGMVQQTVTPPPAAEAQSSGLLQTVLGSSFGIVGRLLGGGIDVVADAFAAQNRQLLQMMGERDRARADAKVLLAFYESNAFVDQDVRDRVRKYPGVTKPGPTK